MKKMSYQQFKELVLFRKVVKWEENKITLDNGISISIEMTDSDCCASAGGHFANVKLDAAITFVGEPVYTRWDDGDTYGCDVTINMLHNQNLVCAVNASADAGNGGYYYSVASFVVKFPNVKKEAFIPLVGSEGP